MLYFAFLWKELTVTNLQENIWWAFEDVAKNEIFFKAVSTENTLFAMSLQNSYLNLHIFNIVYVVIYRSDRFVFTDCFLYVTRQVNLSVAIIPMSHQFGWNASVAGLVQSSFFWGYALSQLPGGWLAKIFGGRLVHDFLFLYSVLNTFLH